MKEQIKKAVSLGLTVITAGSIITYTVSTKSEAASGLTVLFKNSSDNSVKVVNGYQIKEDLSGVYIQAPGAVEFVKTDIGGRCLYTCDNKIYYQDKHDIQYYDLASGQITTVKSYDDYKNFDIEGASGYNFIINMGKGFFDQFLCTFNIKSGKLYTTKFKFMDCKDNLAVTSKDSYSADRTLYKVKDNGVKKLKVLTKKGINSVFFGNKKIFFFEKDTKKKTLSIKSCDLKGKNIKTLKSVKFPNGNYSMTSGRQNYEDIIKIEINGKKFKLDLTKDKISKDK